MTADLTWFSSDPGRELPASVALPRGGLRHAGVEAAGTNRVLWIRLGGRVGRLPVAGPWTIEPVHSGLVCWSAAADVLVSDEVSVNLDPRVRRGLDTTVSREPGGPWVAGVWIPTGAKWARDTRPFAEGRGLTWSDSGWRYRWSFDASPVPIGPISKDEPEPVVQPDLPEDAISGRAKVGGLRVVATRVEGELVRGWLRDGTQVLARSE